MNDTEFDFLANALRQRDQHPAIRATLDSAKPAAGSSTEIVDLDTTSRREAIDGVFIGGGATYVGTDNDGFGHFTGFML